MESDADSRWQESWHRFRRRIEGVDKEVICNSETESTAAFNIEVTLGLREYRMTTGNMQHCRPPGPCDNVLSFSANPE